MDADTPCGTDRGNSSEAIEVELEPMRAGHPRISSGELIAVAAGGALGALGRVGLAQAWPTAAGDWPWATFSVNVAGAFVLGCLLVGLRRHAAVSITVYRLLGTGFCGAFTTFSTMQVELLRMVDRVEYGLAAAYLAGSVAAGYLAVVIAGRLAGATIVQTEPATERV